MNYNTLRNKPTINHKELIGNNKASDIGGMTEEDMEQLLETDLTPYYTKEQIDDLFSRSFVYREKSGSIVTFDCPSTSQTIPEVTVGIEAVQSGTGDPSPTNVRPISGFSAVNVYDGPTTDPQDATVYTIDLDGTRYGGTLDVVSGVLTVDRVILYIDGSENGWSTDQVGTQHRRRFTCIGLPSLGASKDITFDAISNMFVNTKSSDYVNMDNVFILRYLSQYRTNRIDIMTETYQDLTAFKSFLSNSNLTVVYELTTPQTIQLTPTAVKSLLGTNNLWADTGDIEVKCLDRIIPAEE